MNLLSFAMFPVLIMAHGIIMEKPDDSLIGTEPQIVEKREASASKQSAQSSVRQKEFYDFVEDKLIEHSQALEHLIQLVNQAVGALSNLAENVGRNIEEPKLPERIQVEPENQERSGDVDESRRSYWGRGKPLNLPSLSNVKSSSSAWCSVAVLCHRTMEPVCGYDDSFGYGKFDDLCHLIQVNCYWNYNFGLVPNCRSSL